MSTSQVETGRLRHDAMYRLLATWHKAGSVDRDRLYRKALAGCSNAQRAPDIGLVDAGVQVATILMGVYAGDDALCADIDSSLLATNAEKDAFGCFVSSLLPPIVNALHQGALAKHVGDHSRELDYFCAAAVHAWMCQV
tara:strand:+ start:2285 stop:2701 length:417 start_codon:yes stop_codon:yes gene_type:complete